MTENNGPCITGGAEKSIVCTARKPSGTDSGFTLLEMLLAVSILALVITVMYSSLSVGIKSWEKGERDIEFYQKMRAASELLHREISSTFPYSITPGEFDTHKKFYAFYGKSDSLKLVSYADLHKRTGGLSLLELWVDEDRGLLLGEDAALVTNQSDLNNIDLRDDDRTIELCPNVKKVEFRYFDREKKDGEGEWLERWDPKNKGTRLPLFVEISIVFIDDREVELKHRLIVPIMSTII